MFKYAPTYCSSICYTLKISTDAVINIEKHYLTIQWVIDHHKSTTYWKLLMYKSFCSKSRTQEETEAEGICTLGTIWWDSIFMQGNNIWLLRSDSHAVSQKHKVENEQVSDVV